MALLLEQLQRQPVREADGRVTRHSLPSGSHSSQVGSDVVVNRQPERCDAYCDALHATNFYMGPIHPRLKKPVGQRAAVAAMTIAYPPAGQSAAEAAASPVAGKPYTGPTVSLMLSRPMTAVAALPNPR